MWDVRKLRTFFGSCLKMKAMRFLLKILELLSYILLSLSTIKMTTASALVVDCGVSGDEAV